MWLEPGPVLTKAAVMIEWCVCSFQLAAAYVPDEPESELPLCIPELKISSPSGTHWSGASSLSFSIAEKLAPPLWKELPFNIPSFIHGEFYCPAWRNSWSVLLNVRWLLSHQLVSPGVSGQQYMCTMWLFLQPQASYSLSFPDLSHAHSTNQCCVIRCYASCFFSLLSLC